MHEQPFISCIIPCFNSEAYIEETLQSVFDQTYKHFEVIVVNDGSTDNTPEILNKYRGKITILNQENKGVGAARNNGVKHSKGDWIAFLDADDLWHKKKLERQVEITRRFPDIIAIGSSIEPIDENGNALPQYFHKPYIVNRPFYALDILKRQGNIIGLSPSNCLIKKETYLKCGGFREIKRMLSLDFDLWFRLLRLGKIYIIDEPLCYYRILPQSMIHGDLRKEYFAQLYIIEKNRKAYSKSSEFKQIKSKIYFKWGKALLYENSREAYKYFFKAIKLNKLFLPAYLFLIKFIVKKILYKGYR
ncbi:MAG: glycosyltransferase [Calditrichia bacterium]